MFQMILREPNKSTTTFICIGLWPRRHTIELNTHRNAHIHFSVIMYYFLSFDLELLRTDVTQDTITESYADRVFHELDIIEMIRDQLSFCAHTAQSFAAANMSSVLGID